MHPSGTALQTAANEITPWNTCAYPRERGTRTAHDLLTRMSNNASMSAMVAPVTLHNAHLHLCACCAIQHNSRPLFAVLLGHYSSRTGTCRIHGRLLEQFVPFGGRSTDACGLMGLMAAGGNGAATPDHGNCSRKQTNT